MGILKAKKNVNKIMFLEKLLEFPKKKVLVLITVISFIAFLLLTLIMLPTEMYLKENTGYGVFNAWGADGKQRQAIVTYIDFLYIPSYAFCYTGCIMLITRKLEGKSQKTGLILTLTPFIAGIFDVIENMNLLLMIANNQYINSGSPFIASLCATIKFGLIFLGWIFMLYGVLILLRKKLKK